MIGIAVRSDADHVVIESRSGPVIEMTAGRGYIAPSHWPMTRELTELQGVVPQIMS